MLLLTCPFGLSSLLTTELKRLGYTPRDVFPTGCWLANDALEDIITINLHSRIANKAFLEVSRGSTNTFDELFERIRMINRKKYILPRQGCVVTATSQGSLLHSLPTLQSVAHKALVTGLTGSSEISWQIDDHLPPAQIYLYLHNNQAHVLLNTSGASLHQRGRRVGQGEAPIKENLAVATLLSASRPFHQPLRDPCCGSGTLVIEAARLARNIAPGIQRTFAFQQTPFYQADLFEKVKQQAKEKEFTKPRTIIGSDNDPSMIELAKKNAISAGVDDIVQFYYHDIFEPTKLPALQGPTTVICNPPYGQRLQIPDTHQIHQRLTELLQQPGRNGAVITGYDQAETIFPLSHRKRKETRQGKEKCFIYVPKKSPLGTRRDPR